MPVNCSSSSLYARRAFGEEALRAALAFRYQTVDGTDVPVELAFGIKHLSQIVSHFDARNVVGLVCIAAEGFRDANRRFDVKSGEIFRPECAREQQVVQPFKLAKLMKERNVAFQLIAAVQYIAG
jgi:hypothetical protein